MISLFLFLGTIYSTHAALDCQKGDKEITKFVGSYVQAYNNAQHDKLKNMMTPAYWEQFKTFAPKKKSASQSVKILEASTLDGYCLVRWSTAQAANSSTYLEATFLLKKNNADWKLDSILPVDN